MARRILILALLGLLTANGPAFAQEPAAPYDANLQRLAEILGALHYLRGICGSNEGQKWRNQMQALVDAEAPNGERRTRMVASFNRGFRIFQQATGSARRRPIWSSAVTSTRLQDRPRSDRPVCELTGVNLS